MEFIKGITFSPFSPKGSLSSKEAKNSLKNLIEGTGANYIVLVPNALQEPRSQKKLILPLMQLFPTRN